MAKKKKKKAWKIVVAVLAVLIAVRLAAGALFGGGGEEVPMVDTAEAAKGTVTSTLETSGVIASEVTRVYASAVNAQVGDIPVAVGQSVQKGEYLLTYDTASLEKSYNIAELQAKAENAASSDSLVKSSESAGDLAQSGSEMQSLQGQIDAVNAEIASLQAQATQNEIDSNNNAQIGGEVSALQAEIEGLDASIAQLQAKQDNGAITDKEKESLKKLKSEKKSKEEALKKKKKSVKSSASLANALTNIQALLSQKNSQLAQLQGKLSEAQSKNASAEAGILSEQARSNISYTQQASKLTLEQAADDLSRAKAGITADFDGIVTEVEAAAGTMAAEGTPLVTLASAKDMCVEMPVSKYNLENLTVGQDATVMFQDKEYAGKVSSISKVAQKGESGAAMVMVKVHIDSPDDGLILGLDANVTVDLGKAENVVLVPVSSVNSDTEGDFVYVVENQTVVKKYVETGMASKEEMEIKSGIGEGEKVITAVGSEIMEGMAVMELKPQDLDSVPSTEAAE